VALDLLDEKISNQYMYDLGFCGMHGAWRRETPWMLVCHESHLWIAYYSYL